MHSTINSLALLFGCTLNGNCPIEKLATHLRSRCCRPLLPQAEVCVWVHTKWVEINSETQFSNTFFQSFSTKKWRFCHVNDPEFIFSILYVSKSQYFFPIWIIIVLIHYIWETYRKKLKKHSVTKICKFSAFSLDH